MKLEKSNEELLTGIAEAGAPESASRMKSFTGSLRSRTMWNGQKYIEALRNEAGDLKAQARSLTTCTDAVPVLDYIPADSSRPATVTRLSPTSRMELNCAEWESNRYGREDRSVMIRICHAGSADMPAATRSCRWRS